MKLLHAATLVALSTAQPTIAQSGNIPAEVIQECNADADASKLPECLKDGALAFSALRLAQSPEFYGDSALPVIEACRSSNDTFHATWVCFDIAAAKASETRQLVGLENISDACVAGISDSEIHSRLKQEYKADRLAMFPDEMFSGGTMYTPFRGCSEASN